MMNPILENPERIYLDLFKFHSISLSNMASALKCGHHKFDIQNEPFSSCFVSTPGSEWYLVRVELTVTDVNDNVPEWNMVPAPYLAVVSPDAPAGSLVYKLQAQDGDEGNNGEVEYFLSDGRLCFFLIPLVSSSVIVYCKERKKERSMLNLRFGLVGGGQDLDTECVSMDISIPIIFVFVHAYSDSETLILQFPGGEMGCKCFILFSDSCNYLCRRGQ